MKKKKTDIRTTRNMLINEMALRAFELRCQTGREWSKEKLSTDSQWSDINNKLQSTYN